ncbi:hypothetical protein DFJ74DRAFT_644533 [Hyaloraphidium curvatum]|nr:hypothetical protein DFJ74DRAFT_644533 [Hyaloraphidium curvatum]
MSPFGLFAVALPLWLRAHAADLAAGRLLRDARGACAGFPDLLCIAIVGATGAVSTWASARIPASRIITIGTLNVLLAFLFDAAAAGTVRAGRLRSLRPPISRGVAIALAASPPSSSGTAPASTAATSPARSTPAAVTR